MTHDQPALLHLKIKYATALTVLTLCILLHGCASTDSYPWPQRVVKIEEMKTLEPLRIRVTWNRKDVPWEERPAGTVMLHLHVDEQGLVRLVALIDSSREASLDKAALQTIRETRFVPYRADGVPVPVTVVAPLHFTLKTKPVITVPQ